MSMLKSASIPPNVQLEIENPGCGPYRMALYRQASLFSCRERDQGVGRGDSAEGA